jgi:hypothetical protein
VGDVATGSASARLRAEEALPLDVGALVSVRDRSGAPQAALVVVADSATLTLHLSRAAALGPTPSVVVAYGLHHELVEREVRVVAHQRGSGELVVAASGAPLDDGERRSVERFAVDAVATLTVDGVAHEARLTDVSVLGAGLELDAPGPLAARLADLLVEDGGAPLVPRTRVRLAWRLAGRHAEPVRLGVEFADAGCVAVATRVLIARLAE